MSLKIRWVASIAGFMLSIDQLTKIYVHTKFTLTESVTVIPGFFNLTYVTNRGAAFGFLAQAPEVFHNIFFLSMPPIAIFIILAILKGTSEKEKLQIFALSSIFAGAIGNYIDRIRIGAVIDFLDFYLKWKGVTYSWPAFNIADMAIVGGVGILLLQILCPKYFLDKEIIK